MFQVYREIISFSFFYSNANMSDGDSDGSEDIETVDPDKEEGMEDAEGQVPTDPHEIPPHMTVESTSVE
jgi:hypothetical protein